MERRTALAYAAAAAGTVLAGSTALAATTGFLGGDDPSPVEVEDISSADDTAETTSTTLADPTVMTVVVDEYVTAPAPAGASVPAPVVDDNGGLRAAGLSDDAPDTFDDHGGDRPAGVSDDDWDDDEDEYEDDEHEDEDHDEVEDEDDDHDEDDD